jgi:hypothetical protein
MGSLKANEKLMKTMTTTPASQAWNAEVSHRDRERQSAADQPTKQL